MEKKQYCPRCGQVVETNFCPHCDLEYNDKGIIRNNKKTTIKKSKSALDYAVQQANKAKENQVDIFANKAEMDQELEEEKVNIDFENTTVEELLKDRDEKSLKNIFDDKKDDDISERLEDNKAEIIGAKKEGDDIQLPFSLVAKNKSKKDDDDTEVVFTKEEAPHLEINSNENDSDVSIIEDDENNDNKSESAGDTMSVMNMIKENKKIFMIIVVIILIVAIGAGIFLNHNNKQSQISTIETKINQFYVNNDPKKGYLTKKVDDVSLQPIEQEIKSLSTDNKAEADKLQKEVDDLKRNQDLVNKINSLYVSDRIQGDKILNPALKENIDLGTVKRIENPTNSLEKEINKSIKDAETQKKQQDAAKQAMDKIYKNNQVVSTATKQDYLDAKKAVDAVKNVNFKKNYSEPLRQAKNILDK